MNRIQEFLTRKIGPLPAWTWTLLIAGAVSVYMLMQRRGEPTDPVDIAGGEIDPVTGEFRSSTTTERVDPKTGERYSSTYESSGANVVSPGQIGYYPGYPGYQQGDVYMNYPGGTGNTGTGPFVYPPKTAPPRKRGTVGGYWWTPRTSEDIRYLVSRAGLASNRDEIKTMNPQMRQAMWMAMSFSRIMLANPQIDWTRGNGYDNLLGTPIYIPTAAGGWQDNGNLPPGASSQAPANYTPPSQQTVMQVPAA